MSAAQALEELEGNAANSIPTGLAALDASLKSSLGESGLGGIQKGHVTEVWGPPGAGKTALGYAHLGAWSVRCLADFVSESSLLPAVSASAAASCG